MTLGVKKKKILVSAKPKFYSVPYFTVVGGHIELRANSLRLSVPVAVNDGREHEIKVTQIGKQITLSVDLSTSVGMASDWNGADLKNPRPFPRWIAWRWPLFWRWIHHEGHVQSWICRMHSPTWSSKLNGISSWRRSQEKLWWKSQLCRLPFK